MKYSGNRLLTSTITQGGQSVQVVSNSYDGDASANELVQLPGTPRQWMWPTGPRGNVSQQVSPGAVRNFRHDVTGQTVKAYDDIARPRSG